MKKTSERVLKIDRERDCERGGAAGEARRRRISLVDLRLRSNEARRPAPPQDRPRYFQNTLLCFIKVLSAVCLAAGMQGWAFADSAGHPYSGNLETAEKIASTLYDSLDSQYQKILEPAPITLASIDTPAMMPTQNSNLCRVSVSASFIALINRLAHAKAIDQIEPGYFNRYVTTWS
ncbi:MAG TPA: hypothetical protein VFC44_03855, partial [Candidatus Saccharimonadales bacterium]|nr:hypothetical protein [Candidatus Saccharimonadales bacterium]